MSSNNVSVFNFVITSFVDGDAAMAGFGNQDSEAMRVTSLRIIAQQHLQQIVDEQKDELDEETKRLAELERESRRRETAQASSQTSSLEPRQKGARMRTAEGSWDPLGTYEY